MNTSTAMLSSPRCSASCLDSAGVKPVGWMSAKEREKAVIFSVTVESIIAADSFSFSAMVDAAEVTPLRAATLSLVVFFGVAGVAVLAFIFFILCKNRIPDSFANGGIQSVTLHLRRIKGGHGDCTHVGTHD